MTPPCRIKHHIFYLFSFAIIFGLSVSAPAQTAGEKADFLIVERPAGLLIYNKYQQKLSFQQQAKLLPYQPMQVLEENAHLSDGYTPCIKVRMDNRDYFVIKDEEGNFVNEGNIGYHNLFQNCTVLQDTTEVLSNRTIFISKTPTYQSTNQSQKYFLQKGDRLLRLFSLRGYDYVMTLAVEKDFGWCNLSENTRNQSWRMVRQTARLQKGIPAEISQQIESNIQEVNFLLEQLFTYFNRESGENKPIPRWNIDATDTRITCSLNDPQYLGAFPESTRYLMNSLENAILGTPYSVFHDGGIIEVRRK